MSAESLDLTKSTHNNSALERCEDAGESFSDSYMNIVAETLVKDVLHDVEQDVEQEQEPEEQFYDVTTGLESCKLDEDISEGYGESNSDKQLSFNDEKDPTKSGSFANDSSLTDDEIEVICRYISPDVATDFKKELEAANDDKSKLDEQANYDKSKLDEEYFIDNIYSLPLPPLQTRCQNDEIDFKYPPPMMYLPPECYISPSEMHPSTSFSDPNYYNSALGYQELPPEDMYPPHLRESEVLQHQEMVQAQAQAQIQAHTCEQIESSYFAYSNGEPQSPMYSNFTPPISNNSYPYNNDQYPMVELSDMNACNYSGEPSSFVYPSIYVSSSGLITVLLRNDTSVEMTVDRTVRIVCHRTKMAVASSCRGNMSVLYHSNVKLYQDGNVTHVQIKDVKVKMATDDIWFANEISSFKFDSNLIESATPNYRDLSKDDSVNLLFSADTYGEKLVPQCLEAASMAEYENLPKGGVQVRINGVKITQSGRGDVVVVTGPKYLKMSPSTGLIRINTQYIEVTVEKDINARIRRGGHVLNAYNGRIILSNGRIEAGFDEHNRLKVLSLPGRSPMEVGVKRSRRQPGPPRRRTNALMSEAY